MSEFGEKHTVSRLFGSPPGYVGYEEGGQLTEKVRRKPFSVVLFDEVEKAHPDIFNSLLQILEEGRLTDSQGRVVDFKNTVIIMTTNLGTRDISKGVNLGFQQAGDAAGSYERMKTKVQEELKQHFRPEFLNRVDEIIVFPPLTQEQIVHMVDNMIASVELRLRDRDMSIELTQAAKDLLAERGFDPVLGARPLRRTVQREIEDVLAEKMLYGEVGPGQIVLVDVEGEGPTATFTFHGQKIGELPDLPPFETAEVAVGDAAPIEGPDDSERPGRRRPKPSLPTTELTPSSRVRRASQPGQRVGVRPDVHDAGRPRPGRPGSASRCASSARPRRAGCGAPGPRLSRSTASSRPRHWRSVPAQACAAARRAVVRRIAGRAPGAQVRDRAARRRPGSAAVHTSAPSSITATDQVAAVGVVRRAARDAATLALGPGHRRAPGTRRPRAAGRAPGARWCRARRAAGRRRTPRPRRRCSRRRRAARAGRRTTPAPRRRAARRSRRPPRAAAAPGAGSRAGPRRAPPRRSARPPGRPGVGQRASHSSWTGSTRATGVCCSMNSETSTDHGLASGRRHGRSRACASYHRSTGSWSSAHQAPILEPVRWRCGVGTPRRGLARSTVRACRRPRGARCPRASTGAAGWCVLSLALVLVFAIGKAARRCPATASSTTADTAAPAAAEPSAIGELEGARATRSPASRARASRARRPSASPSPTPPPLPAAVGPVPGQRRAGHPAWPRRSPASRSRSCSTSRPGSPRRAPGGLSSDSVDPEDHLRRRRHLVEPRVPAGDPDARRSSSAARSPPRSRWCGTRGAPTSTAATAPPGRCPASTTSPRPRSAASRPTSSSS